MDFGKLAVGFIFGVIGLVIAITILTSQAPTIAANTNTAAGTALANAGITSTSLAGIPYTYTNVFVGLGVLALSVGFVYLGLKHGK